MVNTFQLVLRERRKGRSCYLPSLVPDLLTFSRRSRTQRLVTSSLSVVELTVKKFINANEICPYCQNKRSLRSLQKSFYFHFVANSAALSF